MRLRPLPPTFGTDVARGDTVDPERLSLLEDDLRRSVPIQVGPYVRSAWWTTRWRN